MEPEISVHRTVDDRRNKRYGRHVAIAVDPETCVGAREVEQRLYARLPSEAWSAERETKVRRFASQAIDAFIDVATNAYPSYRAYSSKRDNALLVTATILADRPSETVDEETALAWGRKFWGTHLEPVIIHCVAKRKLYEERERVAKDATAVARWLGAAAVEKAEKVTRYSQRLAALRAELEAEIKQQLGELREDGDRHEEAVKAVETWRQERSATDGKSPVADAAVALGFEHAARYAGVPFGFPNSPADLRVSDLYPEPKTEKED